MSVPRDHVGLASERTELAWRRTALATVAGAAALARLTSGLLGVTALVALGVALALGAWILVGGRARRAGVAPVVLSAAVALMALVELAALLADLR